MPVFAFTIGSLGDILAVAGIASTVIKALVGSAGACDEYQELIIELGSRMKMVDVVNGLMDEVGAAHALLVTIYRKIDGYQACLGKEGSGKDSWRKIGWSIFRKPDLVKWRARLQDHRGNLQMYPEHTSLIEIGRTMQTRPKMLGYIWERGLMTQESPVELIDFLGVRILIPLQLCITWDEFDRFLKFYFRSRERAGEHLVADNDYSITSSTGSDLMASSQWNTMAGRQIYMNAILATFKFELKDSKDQVTSHICRTCSRGSVIDEKIGILIVGRGPASQRLSARIERESGTYTRLPLATRTSAMMSQRAFCAEYSGRSTVDANVERVIWKYSIEGELLGDSIHHVACECGGKIIGRGSAFTKNSAKRIAAKEAYSYFYEANISSLTTI
ncbi:hypothetical protein EVG20_g4041 [Dentipellis fragilis]|uniref:Ubiquitin-like domain-containing protein n=1 Tax=Dentipellis fragilis TaxID=205917 RepID=A0A4Y9YZH6_9AGAM|nr:hypothetical protein EVG20_g4041 [Dentipellis fragilis]